jgi:hypothetical protein
VEKENPELWGAIPSFFRIGNCKEHVGERILSSGERFLSGFESETVRKMEGERILSSREHFPD